MHQPTWASTKCDRAWGVSHRVYDICYEITRKAELPTVLDSAESSLKINQPFNALKNKFEDLPDYGNFVHVMLNAIPNISLVVLS